ncbi:hypothetical protein GE09DRAFT_1283258 [Coniochaeta sp. 2T2.1]|nr:hypothetical protein GE09DRAFT_1283258 [Coniochaeta sp. 2T2.1]
MLTPKIFRYSNGQIATREAAASFSWEVPVPVNPFWDSIDYCTARNFLGCFSNAELEDLPIDVNSNADTPTKLRLLLALLKEKISSLGGTGLRERDYDKWHALHQALFRLQDVLDLPLEAEETINLLVTHSKNKFVTQHAMSDYLIKQGKFREAEEGERAILEWMESHPRLGRDGPQAINARRVLVRALWGQGEGRRVEAEEMLKEVEGIVEGMGGGRFGVYKEEEGRLNEEMRRDLGA